jgi:hypothetical protein
MVSITIWVSGEDSRISGIAESPEPPGMLMSRINTWGWCPLT